MAMDKLMLAYAALDVVFVLCGALMMAFSLMSESLINGTPTLENVAEDLLLGKVPLSATAKLTATAGVANAVFTIMTFLLAVPVLVLPSNKAWLRLQGWLVVICAVFTLVLGLEIWFETLATRANLSVLWAQQDATRQSLLQQRFNCCGYLNSTAPPFVADAACPNALVATQRQGCVGPFAAFANSYLDLVFTAAFAVVGLDVVLLLCIVMVIKRRGELLRYRHIDEKNNGGF